MKSTRRIDPNIKKYQEFMSSRIKTEVFKRSSKIALFELHMDYPTHIAFGEISTVLRKRGIYPVGHKPIWNKGLTEKLRFQIEKKIEFDKGSKWPFFVFRTFGIKTFVSPRFHTSSAKSSWKVLRNLPTKVTKEAILQLKFREVIVGDLFYDWHMNVRKQGTIHPGSLKFKIDLFKFLCTVAFWDRFFSKYLIDCVFVSHTCYGQGILTRIAIKYNVKSFQITSDRMYRLTEETFYADSEFHTYDPESSIQYNYKIDIERAKQRISALRVGDKNIDAAHALVSGYSGGDERQIIQNKEGLNCIVAAHCFSDAPHAFGPQLFPDYLEWITAILEASVESTNKWFIRPHPAFSKGDWKIFNNLLTKYSHVTPLNLETSVTNLIKQGVDVLFTSHGTIAFEAALEGVVVIGGSKNAAFKNYRFAYIPQSKEELVLIVKKLKNLDEFHTPNKDEILHYYDLHHLRSETSWLFKDQYHNFLNRVGGLRRQFSNTQTFSAWLEMSTSASDLEYLHTEIENFIDSNEYFYKFNTKLPSVENKE